MTAARKTILCFGDSNTWGCPPIVELPIGVLERYEPGSRWTGVLQQELGEGFHVIEEGLGGRTTVWDDPIMGGHRNGKTYLLPCLQSHCPVHLVIIMLGTCDLKSRFGLSPLDVAGGMAVLVEIVRSSGAGPGGAAPRMLILSPPLVAGTTLLAEDFAGAESKSAQLPRYFAQLAEDCRCSFMAAGDTVRPSTRDGVHLESADHGKLGRAVADRVKRILED